MGIWNRIFQRSDQEVLDISSHFGRFSDAYKPSERYAHWDQSVRFFDDENYAEALASIIQYLLNDAGDNAFLDTSSRSLDLYLIQGSKKIIGHRVKDRIVMTATLAKGVDYSTGLLRRLLEKNYALNYSRFALNDQNELIIIFDTYIKDANPYKLYFGLQELAIQADKIDDLILSEFEELLAQTEAHTRPVSDSICKIKSNFYFTKLVYLKNQLLEGELKTERDPHIIIYSILSSFYELDYLLVPHGSSTDQIERAHKNYFADAMRPVELKISDLLESIDNLLAIQPAELNKEWYDVIYTFGINPPIDLYQAKSKIQTDIKKIEWYIENNKFLQAKAVTGFIIGYILFDYSVDQLLKSLLTMYYRLTNEKYFNDLGFKSHFISSNGSLRKKQIETEFKQIIDTYETDFHAVQIPLHLLTYQSIYHFGVSLLHVILQSSFSIIEARN